MKLLQVKGDTFVFELDKQEKILLFELLKLYPLVPLAHHRLSKAADPKELAPAQQLLEEAVAEQRQENKRQLLAMLNDPQRFEPVERGFRLHLTGPQIEWLLQVLNDLRVGSWVILGEPDYDDLKHLKLALQNPRYFLTMEISGQFQALLLHALDGNA